MNEAEKAEMCCVFSFSTTTTDNNSVTAFANSLNILEQFFHILVLSICML